MKRLSLFFFIIALLCSNLFADFNRNTGVIDIPTAEMLGHLNYRVGFDLSYAIDAEHSMDDRDENFHASMGFGNNFEGYLDVYTISNFTTAFGFCHRFYQSDAFALAWGIHHLSYAMDVSEVGHGDSIGWDDDLSYSTKEDYEKPFELGSAFLVSTIAPNEYISLTAGLGRGKYVGYGPHSKYFNSNFYHEKGGSWAVGLLLGMEYKPTKNISFMLDLDGRDANVGMKFFYSPVEFCIALAKVEQFGMAFSPRVSTSFSYMGIKQEKKPCIIAGTIFDTEGGTLSAKVGLLSTKIPVVVTSDKKGRFQFKLTNAGIYTVYAEAEGYLGAKKQVRAIQGETVTIALALKKKPPETGDLTGKVFNMKTGAPVVAKLSLSKIAVSKESDSMGLFTFKELKPGVYDIKVEAESYELAVVSEVITAGEQTKVEIGMVKKGMVITLRGVKFDFNKATLKPESYPILEQGAKILKTHPNIRVEVQGHTDSKGSDAYNLKLSNARANSVCDYLIRNKNIEPSRLVARGYGERKPIADNRTDEGRAQNRRVDFLILK